MSSEAAAQRPTFIEAVKKCETDRRLNIPDGWVVQEWPRSWNEIDNPGHVNIQSKATQSRLLEMKAGPNTIWLYGFGYIGLSDHGRRSSDNIWIICGAAPGGAVIMAFD